MLAGLPLLRLLDLSANHLAVLPPSLTSMKQLEVRGSSSPTHTHKHGSLSLCNITSCNTTNSNIYCTQQSVPGHAGCMRQLSTRTKPECRRPHGEGLTVCVCFARAPLPQYLDLQGNRLVALPAGFGSGLHQRLADLDLSQNDLRSLPADFSRLTGCVRGANAHVCSAGVLVTCKGNEGFGIGCMLG